MKNLTAIFAVQACLLAAGAALAGVTPHPLDLTTGSHWRTGANVSLEADGQYGSSGYALFGVNLPDGTYLGTGFDISSGSADNQYSLPDFIAAVAAPAGVSYSMWTGNGNFGQIEDPANGNALTATPALLRDSRPGNPCDLTLQRATGDAFRLTVIMGLSSDGGYANNGTLVTVEAGAAGSASGSTSAAPNGGVSGTPGMMYLTFDVGPGTDDILLRLAGSGANLAGVAFDPEVTSPPIIVQQPAGLTCLVGVAFKLTVSAGGSDPLAFQWYKGASPVTDATEAALSFPSLALTDAGTYSVVITNAYGAVTSNPVVLDVAAELPAKTANYENAVQSELSIFAYYPFNTLTADDLTTAHNGVLAGQAGFGTGLGGGADKALLLNGQGHVKLGTSPDFEFSDTSGTVEAWLRADWTSAASAPCIFANRNGGPTRWSIHMAVDKSQLAFWNGGQVAWIGIPNASTNWHHFASVFDNGTWLVYWDGQLAGSASIGLGGATGLPTQIGSVSEDSSTESWVGAIDELAFYSDALSAEAVRTHFDAFHAGEPPVIVGLQPESGQFLAGVPLTLKVLVSGPEPLTYKWFKADTQIPDAATSSLSFASLVAADAAAYHVVVSNDGGSVTSNPVVIELTATLPAKTAEYENAVQGEPSIFAYYPFNTLTADDLTTAHNGTLAGQASFGAGLGGGADKALLLNGAGHVKLGASPDFDFSDTTGTVEAWLRADWSTAGNNPCIFASRNGGPTLWSIHMAADKSQVAFWNGTAVQWVVFPSNAGTNWHHFASVFDNGTWLVYWDGQLAGSGNIGLGGATGLPTQLGSSAEDSTAEGWIGALDEVAFYADALSAEAVRAHFDAFHAGEPPVIVTQPQGGKFLTGADVALSVGATGPQLSYQWYRNNEPVPDATGASLTLAAATPENSGTYSVTVSNITAVVISSNAVVVVVAPDLAAYRASALAQSSLISYYPFDDGTANDVVSENHGTLAGSAAFEPGLGGDPNQAVVLTGGHVALGQVEAFDFASKAGTVELLLRADWTASPGYNPTIFADRDGGPVNYSIHLTVSKDQIAFWNGAGVSFISIPQAGPTWHHFAVVFDAGAWSVYWDGQLRGTLPLALGVHPEAPTDLGSASAAGSEQWLGALDEVAFFSTALSAETISGHYGALVKAAPSLHCQKTGNQLSLSWTATGFKLQANSDLAHPTGWQDVAGGDVSPASVPIGATAMRFFRLISQ